MLITKPGEFVTNGGDRAVVVANTGDSRCPWLGYCVEGDRHTPLSWDDTGSCRGSSHYDINREAPTKYQTTIWLSTKDAGLDKERSALAPFLFGWGTAWNPRENEECTHKCTITVEVE